MVEGGAQSSPGVARDGNQHSMFGVEPRQYERGGCPSSAYHAEEGGMRSRVPTAALEGRGPVSIRPGLLPAATEVHQQVYGDSDRDKVTGEPRRAQCDVGPGGRRLPAVRQADESSRGQEREDDRHQHSNSQPAREPYPPHPDDISLHAASPPSCAHCHLQPAVDDIPLPSNQQHLRTDPAPRTA